jgi:hypothetical protein
MDGFKETIDHHNADLGSQPENNLPKVEGIKQ